MVWIQVCRKPTNHHQICSFCHERLRRGEVRVAIYTAGWGFHSYYHPMCLIKDIVMRSRDYGAEISISEIANILWG